MICIEVRFFFQNSILVFLQAYDDSVADVTASISVKLLVFYIKNIMASNGLKPPYVLIDVPHVPYFLVHVVGSQAELLTHIL